MIPGRWRAVLVASLGSLALHGLALAVFGTGGTRAPAEAMAPPRAGAGMRLRVLEPPTAPRPAEMAAAVPSATGLTAVRNRDAEAVAVPEGVAIERPALPSYPARRRFFGFGLGGEGAPAEASSQAQRQFALASVLPALLQGLQSAQGPHPGPDLACRFEPAAGGARCEPRAPPLEAAIDSLVPAGPGAPGAFGLVRRGGIWQAAQAPAHGG